MAVILPSDTAGGAGRPASRFIGMRPTGASVIRFACLALVVACGSNSAALDSSDPAGTGASTGFQPPDPGPRNCIWAGSWDMVAAQCGDAGYDQWLDVYVSTNLDISHNLVDGCDLMLTLSSRSCTETTAWWAMPAEEDTSVALGAPPEAGEGVGTVACYPDGCELAPGVAACELGAHAAPLTVGVVQSGGSLEFTNFATYAAPNCTDGLRLVFQRKGSTHPDL